MNTTLGDTAEFNCTGYSNDHYWTINDKILTHPNNEDRDTEDQGPISAGNGSYTFLLLVPATWNNDGISVHCYLITQPNFFSHGSSTAYLEVQGKSTNGASLYIISKLQ